MFPPKTSQIPPEVMSHTSKHTLLNFVNISLNSLLIVQGVWKFHGHLFGIVLKLVLFPRNCSIFVQNKSRNISRTCVDVLKNSSGIIVYMCSFLLFFIHLCCCLCVSRTCLVIVWNFPTYFLTGLLTISGFSGEASGGCLGAF